VPTNLLDLALQAWLAKVAAGKLSEMQVEAAKSLEPHLSALVEEHSRKLELKARESDARVLELKQRLLRQHEKAITEVCKLNAMRWIPWRSLLLGS
jgi:hypothetical protein